MQHCYFKMSSLLTCVFIWSFLSSKLVEVEAETKLLIDLDGGADDAMAICVALLYEQYFEGPEVVAVTTTHGNVNEDQTFQNTQKILYVAQRRDVPVYRGSSSSLVISYPTDNFFGIDGLGETQNMTYKPLIEQPEHAVLALIELSKIFEGELIVLTLGTLTNIALAIKLDPLFIGRLAHLYIAAGHIYSEEYPKPEFNAKMDVEAYHIVTQYSNPDKVTIIPFSTVRGFNISMDWRNNVLGAIPTPIMETQNMFERISNSGKDTWSLLDPIAMAMVLNSDIIEETKYTNNSIILCGEQRGINTNKFTDIQQANANIVTAANQTIVQTFLIQVFSAQLYV